MIDIDLPIAYPSGGNTFTSSGCDAYPVTLRITRSHAWSNLVSGMKSDRFGLSCDPSSARRSGLHTWERWSLRGCRQESSCPRFSSFLGKQMFSNLVASASYLCAGDLGGVLLDALCGVYTFVASLIHSSPDKATVLK